MFIFPDFNIIPIILKLIKQKINYQQMLYNNFILKSFSFYIVIIFAVIYTFFQIKFICP